MLMAGEGLALHVTILNFYVMLPRPQVARVCVVQDDAQSFVGCYHGGDAEEPLDGCEDAEPAVGSREGEEDGYDEAKGDVGHAHGTDEEDAGFVAVADGPPDEVGM